MDSPDRLFPLLPDWSDFRAVTRAFRDAAQDPNWLYHPVTAWQSEPWQGDVIPFARLAYVLRDGEHTDLYEGAAMLLSHGCDCVEEQDPSAVLAPVYSLDTAWRDDPHRRVSRIDALKTNQYASLMFLPGNGETPDSFVNFAEASSVPTGALQSWFREATPLTRRLRFSTAGGYFFVLKLAYYFARAEDRADFPRG
jgi:hypothetical protein